MLQPGDLFRWTSVGEPILELELNTRIWSTSMKAWVPADGPCLVICHDKSGLSYLHRRGRFRVAMIDPVPCGVLGSSFGDIVPRKYEP